MHKDVVESKLKNPITGEVVDEIIKQKEAIERGYFDYQFILKYLEDENEFVKYFIVEGKKIVVDIAKPTLEYKKKTKMDYERVLQDNKQEKKEDNIPVVPTPIACDTSDETCLSCSG